MPTIFLTSLPRSGSTWAAEAITALTGSRYVNEPFNWTVRPASKPYYMKYMRAGACDPGFVSLLKRSIRAPTGRQRARERLLGRHLVTKDVHCCLAVECVQRHLNASVVILVRHPCAMASSWDKLGFHRELDLLVTQEKLMEEHLAGFEAHLRASRDRFFEVGAFWGASYHVLARLARRHPEWQWVTHEYLCRDPQQRFRALLDRLRVRPSDDQPSFFTEHDRPLATNEDPYATFRESGSEPGKWRALLSKDEARKVMRGAEPFDVEALLRLGG